MGDVLGRSGVGPSWKAGSSSILEDYVGRTAASSVAQHEASQWLPGGSTRAATWWAPYPVWMAEGQGSKLVDVDGNEYVDLLNNYTSLIHGHAHPVVVEAVSRQLRDGSVYGAPTRSQLELARLICTRLPSCDQLRFTNSGTEAVMHAVWAARAFTGRGKVAKVEGAYHGTWDGLAVSTSPDAQLAGLPGRPIGIPDGPGIPPSVLDQVSVLPFNRLDDALACLEQVSGELAAVIVEPINSRGGMIPADRGYLAGLEEFCRATGSLLILDEVITFRLGSGGAQELYGVRPDLTTLGKVIGGGLPIGAVGGRADVMAVFDPEHGSVGLSGTFNGNPLAMTAGRVSLELMSTAEFDRINALGENLRARIEALSLLGNSPVSVTGLGSVLNVHLAATPPASYRDSVAVDAQARHLFHLALLNEGVFAASRGLMCTSTAMTDADVSATVSAVERALRRVAVEVSAEPRGS